MNLNKKIHLFLLKLGDLENKKIAVGYSAGADSTLLLHILAQKAKHFNFQFEAVFFSHNNSPMNHGEDISLIEAQKTCKELNIPLIHETIDMSEESPLGWEGQGRSNRINFYKNNNYDFVFLGHHEDDQNETTMIQLFRGAGRAIAGMKEVDGIFCRPLLNVRKSDIYDFLKQENLTWVEDPTNTNTDFTRNFWRKIGLPTIEKHYPEYSKSLSLFRKKQIQQSSLLLELAKIDGLEKVYNGETINIKDLSSDRFINLLTNVFSKHSSHIETPKLEEAYKKIQSQKNLSIETNKLSLTLFRDKKDVYLSLNVKPTLKNKL